MNKNLSFFRRHQHELNKFFHGKYILIWRGEVQGDYELYEQAIQDSRKYGFKKNILIRFCSLDGITEPK